MNFNRLDLNLLRVFDELIQSRSVTNTASNLGLTQPAVSNQLSRLREAFGDPLFVRTTEGMMPTPKALAIAEPIRQSLVQIRSTVDQQIGFDPATSDRTFRIFMADTGQFALLPRLLDHLAATGPNINIQTIPVLPYRMREVALESGEVDLAVGYFASFEGPYHYSRLFDEPYAAMARAGHPTIGDTLSMETFFDTPHLVYQPTGGGHSLQDATIDKAFAAAGRQRRVAVRIAHAMGLPTIMKTTDLLAIAPRGLGIACQATTDVKVLKLPIEVPDFPVRQYWHDRFHADPGNMWLRSVFTSLYTDKSRAWRQSGSPPGTAPTVR